MTLFVSECGVADIEDACTQHSTTQHNTTQQPSTQIHSVFLVFPLWFGVTVLERVCGVDRHHRPHGEQPHELSVGHLPLQARQLLCHGARYLRVRVGTSRTWLPAHVRDVCALKEMRRVAFTNLLFP